MSLQSEQIDHQVNIRRYSAATVKKMIELLRHADADLKVMIETADLGTKADMEELLSSIRVLNRDLWKEFDSSLQSELLEFVEYEAGFQTSLLTQFDVATPKVVSPDTLKALVTARPFQGKYLKEWTKSLSDAQYQRIRDAIRIGVTNGYTTQQIVQDVIGRSNRRFKDGRIAIGKRQAEAVVRTAITHVSNAADNEVYKRNKGHIDQVQYSAILDGRTTAICRSLDGNLYGIGKGPRPPQHIGCRSISIPIMKGDKPVEESYEDWLRKQPAAKQDEILGHAKGRLFREGGLPLERFMDRRGNELTLDELKERDRKLWDSIFSGL